MGKHLKSAAMLAALLALEACAGVTPPSASAPSIDAGPALRLARAARAAGDYASAVNLYRTVAAGGSNPLITVELGDTLLDAGSIDDAMGVYKSVPEGSPGALGAALGLERVFLALDDVPHAMQQADRAHALAPDDRRVLIDRGIVLDLAGRHDEAQRSYRAMLAKAPDDRAARVDLALSLALTHNYDEATSIVMPIARSSDATPRERQDLALIYGLKGDEPEAKRWSLLDLDRTATAGNLQFYDFIRDGGH